MDTLPNQLGYLLLEEDGTVIAVIYFYITCSTANKTLYINKSILSTVKW